MRVRRVYAVPRLRSSGGLTSATGSSAGWRIRLAAQVNAASTAVQQTLLLGVLAVVDAVIHAPHRAPFGRAVALLILVIILVGFTIILVLVTRAPMLPELPTQLPGW